MIKAHGYVLLVPPERAETLLHHSASGAAVGEPVPSFSRGNRAPMLVLAAFTAGAITHIALGRKGVASGTGLVRLNLAELEPLTAQIRMERLLDEIPSRLRSSVARRLREGGPLAPAGFRAVVTAISKLAPELSGKLTRFTGDREAVVARMSARTRQALSEQKESVALALKMSGLDSREVLEWMPPADAKPRSFLDGLPGARVREDAMVVHDLGQVPGFEGIGAHRFAAKTFEKDGTRLTVILANKLPLEEQFGTDLIYFNETYRGFVMVQYKAMERAANGRSEFRLPNRQLDIEIERMDATLDAMSAIEDDPSRDAFRLHSGPFFLKLCSRHVFNPDDGGLFPGMYIPLDYWRRLIDDPATVGERGGRLVTFENVGRRLSEAEFIGLVANGWIGSGAAQSEILTDVVRSVLEHGKAVALAIRSSSAVDGAQDE